MMETGWNRDYKEKLTEYLIERELMEFFPEGKKLKSGRLSPYYINLRTQMPVVQSELAEFVADSIGERIKKKELERKNYTIVGIPEAAVPGAFFTGFHLMKKEIIDEVYSNTYRKFPEEGKKRLVFGDIETDVLLYDDVITTAGSKYDALSALEEGGIEKEKVKGLVIMVDRCEKSTEPGKSAACEFEEETGIQVMPVITTYDIMRYLDKKTHLHRTNKTRGHDYFEELDAMGKYMEKYGADKE